MKHKKIIFIARPTKVLILSLQRINFITNNKNECNVIFPEKLNINEFIDKDFGFNNNSEYCLYSVINHLGLIDLGHYFSYIKIHNDLWLKFDDNNVQIIDKNLVVNENNENAYILLYVNKN